MKILVIAATPFFSDRGCHLRIYNEAIGLKKLGHEVRICTYHNGKDIPSLDIFRIKPVNWYKKTSPGFAWGKIWLDWQLLFLVKKQIRQFSPDILHCHLYEGLAIGFFSQLFSQQKKPPLVADLQGDLSNELENYNTKNFIIKKTLPIFSNFFLKKANGIVISSQRGQKILQQKYPFLKSSVIQDQIDLETLTDNSIIGKETTKEIEEIKSWKNNSQLLVYAGGLSSSKGLKNFFLFFGKNFSSDDSWKLLIFGSGTEEEKRFYLKTIQENNWKKNIFLAKNHNFFQLPFYLKLGNLAIDPKNNTSESSGKLVIYMSANLPILCFDNHFNREQLKEQGIYFQNWEEIKNILRQKSFLKPVFYFQDKNRCREEVNKLEELFKKLLKQKPLLP